MHLFPSFCSILSLSLQAEIITFTRQYQVLCCLKEVNVIFLYMLSIPSKVIVKLWGILSCAYQKGFLLHRWMAYLDIVLCVTQHNYVHIHAIKNSNHSFDVSSSNEKH